MQYLDGISLSMVLLITVLLGFAPFFPEPHIVEKVRMLMHGQLKRPLDIFDLFWHTWPFVLLVLKLIRMKQTGAF
ncbi:MAG: RND transporter [Hyphomicrobiales bacterium]|nr:MAG: RND transporter [Hyphomicrobiales bacterium]